MKLRRLEARVRRSPRGRVTEPDIGTNAAERPSQAKSRRGKSAKCILPNLLQPSSDPPKSLHQGRTLLPKPAPSFEQEEILSSLGSSQDDCHADAAVKDSILKHGDDDDGGSSVDMDDLSSIDSDDLDRLLGSHEECSSSTLIHEAACQADLVSIPGCNTSTYEPEGVIGVLDGAHAQSCRDPIVVPSLEEISSQPETSSAPSEAQPACPDSMEGPIAQKDGTILVTEGPEVKAFELPVAEVLGDTLNNRSEQEPAASIVYFSDIVEPSPSSAGNRRPSFGIREGFIYAKDDTIAVGSVSAEFDAAKIELVSATANEGTSQESESASPYDGSPGQHGIREMCRMKPTVFEEQYTAYQRSRNGNEVESHKVPRYEVKP